MPLAINLILSHIMSWCVSLTQGVWSEEENSISLLSAEMDYLSCASRSLTQVLDRAASCLGAESDSEGDESDTDEDFDAYYDNDGEDIATQRYVRVPSYCLVRLC